MLTDFKETVLNKFHALRCPAMQRVTIAVIPFGSGTPFRGGRVTCKHGGYRVKMNFCSSDCDPMSALTIQRLKLIALRILHHGSSIQLEFANVG